MQLLSLDVVIWQLAPRPFPDLAHIPILFNRAVHVVGVLHLGAPEAIDGEAAADKGTSAKDNEEDNERWGDLEAHIVSFVEVHGCSGVTTSLL